jgi:hypothetical protein
MWLWAVVLTMVSPLVTALPGQLARNECKFKFCQNAAGLEQKNAKTHIKNANSHTKNAQNMFKCARAL